MQEKTLAIERRIKQIKKELKELKNNGHPELLAKLAELRQRSIRERELVTISYELSKRRIEDNYQRRLEKSKRILESRLKETRVELLREIEEAEKQIELEYNTTEISRAAPSLLETSKKTLRGRGGGVLIEPPTYFNATPKPPTPHVVPQTTYLLSDAEIQSDLRAISVATNQRSPQKQSKMFDVTIAKQRLVYDGKSFKQGEEVVVENNEYGKFPARIDVISESVVSFKATQSWDTRQIYASCSDLIEGRVLIAKKRNN